MDTNPTSRARHKHSHLLLRMLAAHSQQQRTRQHTPACARPLRFSFVIPALNEEAVIAACIQSIQAQHDRPHEIIVVDNGCVDRTIEIAQQLGCITVYEEKPGLSHARNKGAETATGDILCFIDADCTLAKHWLQAAQRCFAQPTTGAVSGLSIYVQASFLKLLWYNLYMVGSNGAVLLSQIFYRRMIFAGNNLAIRRELFLQLGGYEPVIGEGIWLSRRFWQQSVYQGHVCAGMILWNSPRGFVDHGFLQTLAYWIRGAAHRTSQEGYTYKTH